ncbi:gamma-glutamyl-gamma-aminobutyrate hydrolase family protein [Saccharopolyspora spinosa]|uniref:glutamine amidotransferase-related protein n=1 Tax=Saccharopolyspora spinosa TaxID=60894 RepID=UPI00376F2EA9
MRTLIIDNYDSFTYNLAHYLQDVNGEPCEVVRNDDPTFRLSDLDRFDNVVLSPGPGHPERPADFGHCAEVIRHAALPVLGVCLGHQGLCLAYGGTVAAAPEVRHGRLSQVNHEGRGLFNGLPSPFPAVRYHSLVVTQLPDEFEVDAWTPDGVLMAAHHRNRPQWGVQFHPESICTEHGHLLLCNFAELTGRWQRENARPALPLRARVAATPHAAQVEAKLRVLAEELPGWCPPERVFDALYQESPISFWLDSSLAEEQGRFSFMGDASGPLARVVEADVWQGLAIVREADRTIEVRGPFLDWLESDLAALWADVPDLPFDFALGWVGYLGYEMKAECGARRAHRAQTPDAGMIFADRAVAFDHQEKRAYLLALALVDCEQPAQQWLVETGRRWRELRSQQSDEDVPAPAGPVQELRLRHDRHDYIGLIERCQEQIQGERATRSA